MKAIVNTGSNRLEMVEVPLPVPGADQVRIRTLVCGIREADLWNISEGQGTEFSENLGHEYVGMIDAVGDNVDATLVGRKGVGGRIEDPAKEPCPKYSTGFAEYFITETARLHVLPENFPVRVAPLLPSLAIAVHGMKRLGEYKVKYPILIFGDGLLSFLVLLLLAQKESERLFLVGDRNNRLELAKKLGVSAAYHSDRENPELKESKFSTIVETSGSAWAMKTAFDLVAQGGKILMLGNYQNAHADFLWNDFFHREMHLIGSDTGIGDWPGAIQIAGENEQSLEKLMSNPLPAKEFVTTIPNLPAIRKDDLKLTMEW